MFEIIAIANSLLELLLTSFKKDFTAKRIHPLITISLPNLLGHPILLIIIFSLFTISLPNQLEFYITFALLEIVALLGGYFILKGFALSLFSASTFINATSVIFTAIGANIFLNEEINAMQWLYIAIGFIGAGIICLSKSDLKKLSINVGLLYVLLGTVFASCGNLLYRRSATLVPEYLDFLAARMFMDLIFLSASCYLVTLLRKQNIIQITKKLFELKNSFYYIFLTFFRSFVTSFLFFVLPVSTLVVISTFILPSSYLLGRIRYQETVPLRIYLGSAMIITANLLFLMN